MKGFFLKGIAGMLIIVATLATGGVPALYVYKAIDSLNLTGMVGRVSAEETALLMGMSGLVVVWAFAWCFLSEALKRKTNKSFYEGAVGIFGAVGFLAMFLGVMISLIFGFSLQPVLTGTIVGGLIGLFLLLWAGKKLYEAILN